MFLVGVNNIWSIIGVIIGVIVWGIVSGIVSVSRECK